MSSKYITFCLLFIFTACFQTFVSPHQSSEWKTSNEEKILPENGVYEFLTNFPNLNYETKSTKISAACKNDMVRMLTGRRKLELWALKMMDSSSKTPSGILKGNINTLGDMDQCLSAQSPAEDIQGKYCMATIYVEPDDFVLANETLREIFDEIFSYHVIKCTFQKDERGFMLTTNTISWGVCVPNSCAVDDVFHLFESSLSFYNRSGLITRIKINQDECHTKEEVVVKNARMKFNFTSITFAFALLAILATLYDKYNQDPAGDLLQMESQDKWTRVFLAFSLKRTVPFLLDTKFMSDEVTCIHGLRFLATILIFVQHKIHFSFFYLIGNRTEFVRASAAKPSSLFRSFYNGVDVFIYLSAFLTSYYATRTLSRGGKLNIGAMYIARYIKLTPALLFILFVICRNVFVPHTSQFYRVDHYFVKACEDNTKFFLDLLYIQNWFYGVGDMCYPPTHSLATDMQLYLVSPFFILLLWKLRQKKLLLGLIVGAILTSLMILRGIIVYKNKLTCFSIFGGTLENVRESMNKLYINPVHQFTIYFIGLLAGAFMNSLSSIQLNKFQKAIGWVVALSCWYYATFRLSHASLIGYKYDVVENTEYAMMRPLVWGLFLTFIIFICHSGQAGGLNKVLSCGYFVIMSKLSYAIFLTSTAFIVMFASYMQNSVFFNTKIGMIFNLNEIGVILFFSVYMTLLFVLPIKDIYAAFKGKEKVSPKPEEHSTEEKPENKTL